MPKHIALRSRAAAVITAGLCGSVVLTGAAAADGGQSGTLATHGAAESVTGRAAAEKAEKNDASWVSPISDDYELTATYGNSGDRWAAKHSGQDFAVPVGTPVQAVHDGTVVKAGGNGAGDGPAYGNAVVIKHDDDTFTQYAHLSEADVKAGEKVEAGDEIARSGNTGNSSGPHLHFEVRTTADYGSAIDPMKFLREQDADV
ncbi:M23 family metallopeptidase [Streptomyces sp. MP131-18]|uniref:M23 family metallopeptidase n=1 Tax=Streptomyces sp. MP131-18 TaxID=1857892 RepID=UPI00097BF7D6|nr:M23 family metallopeptidase [Streptomyces sp. MP131-18]ONK15154.1 Glycyl-glycine endopeptidase LytM precursor [Streptomyces sp. MP131-18]